MFRFRSPFPALQLQLVRKFGTQWDSSFKLLEDWFWRLLREAKARKEERGESAEALADTALDVVCLRQAGVVADLVGTVGHVVHKAL